MWIQKVACKFGGVLNVTNFGVKQLFLKISECGRTLQAEYSISNTLSLTWQIKESVLFCNYNISLVDHFIY